MACWNEGPGLKPGLIWDGLPRAKARCYSGHTSFFAACKVRCYSGRHCGRFRGQLFHFPTYIHNRCTSSAPCGGGDGSLVSTSASCGEIEGLWAAKYGEG